MTGSAVDPALNTCVDESHAPTVRAGRFNRSESTKRQSAGHAKISAAAPPPLPWRECRRSIPQNLKDDDMPWAHDCGVTGRDTAFLG
jgi:hypothetical protein